MKDKQSICANTQTCFAQATWESTRLGLMLQNPAQYAFPALQKTVHAGPVAYGLCQFYLVSSCTENERPGLCNQTLGKILGAKSQTGFPGHKHLGTFATAGQVGAL